VVYERLNRISPNPSFTPKWSDKPLQKSWQKEKPPSDGRGHGLALSEVRAGDSQADSRRQAAHEVLLNEKVGEIKAQIIERDGQILMVKDCPKHGTLKT